MAHYYDKVQNSLSKPQKYDYYFNNLKFVFHTDSGVFSKNFLDYGTYVLLKNYDPTINVGPLLDMCAGYGPVGIILNKAYQKDVYMTEINERAYDLCLKNIKENKANIKAYCGNLYENLPKDIKYGDILLNPPIRAGKDIIFNIYDGAYERLLVKGNLYVVIQKKQGAPSSKKYLEELFGNCEIIAKDSGYYILRSTKDEKDN